MKFFFHKIAAYSVVIFISAQPVSIDVFAAEKELGQDISILDEDKKPAISKRKGWTETIRRTDADSEDFAPNTPVVLMDLDKKEPKPRFSVAKYLSQKVSNFLAWVNTDIEADLH